MNSHSQSNPSNQFSQVLSALIERKMWWIIPMILGFLLSLFYAFALRSETWSAKQSLIVRDDLLGQSYKPGQFDSLDSMKSAQETIFEIARKPQVIRNALQQIGPPSRGFLGLGGKGYPSEEVIEEMQGNISFSAPNGNEVGQTEVIILNTKSGTRDRAREFTKVLVGEIISKVNEVRHRKFQSMEAEVNQTCEVAQAALEDTKNRLREMDQELGQDSGSMVAMGESSFRDDPLVREIAQLNLERRGVQTEVEQIQGMLKSLRTAKKDPEAIVNISSDLTSRQPALDALKREMVEQKGAYALLSGRYTSVHPAVVSARDGIVVMQNQIRLELDNAESDTREQLGIKTGNLTRLDTDIANLKTRLNTLGKKRADSITLFADIKKRTEVLNNARTSLAKIHGLASAENANNLTTVDEVQVSTRPDGMGKRALIMCGTLGGLMLGMGLVMLMTPPPAPTTDRRRQSISPAPSYPAPTTTPAPLAQTPVTETKFNGTPPPAPATPTPVTAQATSPAVVAPVPVAKEAVTETVKSALEDVGVKSKAGLAASTGVLKGLMGSVKRKPKQTAPTPEEIEKEAKAQKVIDARLNSVKAKKDPEPEPAPAVAETKVTESVTELASSSSDLETLADKVAEPLVEKPAGNPFSSEAIETSKKRAGAGAKIVPAMSNAFKDKPDPTDPAELVKSLVAQKSESELGSPKVETPDVEVPKPAETSDLNKMVDKAFEEELKSPTRSEAQTIQLDTLAKVIGGTTAGVGAAGLALSAVNTKPEVQSDPKPEVQSESETVAETAGAKIRPRSANIRPVDLARQAENDDFDRVGVKGSKSSEATADSKAQTKSPELPEESTPAKVSTNPFLKNRPVGQSPKPFQSSKPFSEDSSVVPVPDQIRKLSDSIASFAKPLKSKGDSKPEKF